MFYQKSQQASCNLQVEIQRDQREQMDPVIGLYIAWDLAQDGMLKVEVLLLTFQEDHSLNKKKK